MRPYFVQSAIVFALNIDLASQKYFNAHETLVIIAVIFSAPQLKHHVLQSPHPSPLSANRGFFGCGHFKEVNRLLQRQGRSPINWGYLPRDQ